MASNNDLGQLIGTFLLAASDIYAGLMNDVTEAVAAEPGSDDAELIEAIREVSAENAHNITQMIRLIDPPTELTLPLDSEARGALRGLRLMNESMVLLASVRSRAELMQTPVVSPLVVRTLITQASADALAQAVAAEDGE